MGAMSGLYGTYDMSQDSSGTSWQPESTAMGGRHTMSGSWMTMWHGIANLVYDDQGGPRGDTKTFANSMLMFMGRRELPVGALGVRMMVSADPLMGSNGYPLLFQTGETADGRNPLIDRQHPHNFLMEAAVSYAQTLAPDSSVFVYTGLAGEPALGPPTFMHRFSGVDNPVAPLGHHWLDSTHITYGVITAGYVWNAVKVEASAFNGREPDQNRYRVELRGLDSWSTRLSVNPTPDLSLQVSYGRLASPEQLQPEVAVRRTTASVLYNRRAKDVVWQTTAAFGRNEREHATSSDAWLLESAVVVSDVHTVFGRAEHVTKDELFTPELSASTQAYNVDSLSLGYIYDFSRWHRARFGVGGSVTAYRYPSALNSVYGSGPLSTLAFLRIKL